MDGSRVMIVNPTAGGGRAGRGWRPLSEQLTAAGWTHAARLTSRPGEAAELCRSALREGATTIVAAGGDGTLNEVANGFWAPDGSNTPVRPGARLGFLPLGTGSDFARSAAVTRDNAVATLVAGKVAAIDVGRVEFRDLGGQPELRYFLNVADLGLGGETALRAKSTPKLLGPLVTYLIAAIRSIIAHRPRLVTLRLDGADPIQAPISMVVVANSCWFGGGMHVVPDAVLDDGQLDVLYIAGAARGALLFNLLPRVYRGKHLGHPMVHHQRAAAVVVESDAHFPLEADGDYLGTTPAAFSVIPRGLWVIVPAHWSGAADTTA